jgi:phage terminase large subunit-like protein
LKGAGEPAPRRFTASDYKRTALGDRRFRSWRSGYREVFPQTVISKTKSAEEDFETTRGGGRFTTSVGGALTGRGGDVLIIDDPIKPQDAFSDVRRKSSNDWYDNTLHSRLDDKRNGKILLTMQRLHEDDLTGHILGKENWDQISLPAIATEDEEYILMNGRQVGRKTGEALHPEREPLEILEQLKQSVGSYIFASQYQQTPVPLAGNLVKWAWFQSYDEPPPISGNRQIVQSWDTAFTENDGSDWSVATTWLVDGKNYYLIDIFRKRLDFPSLKRSVVSYHQRWKANTVLIEDVATGTALKQQLRSESQIYIIGVKPEGTKTDHVFKSRSETALCLSCINQ